MKRRYFTLLLLLTFQISLNAQLNTTLLANLDYQSDANDIWGWEDEDGTEYVLLGLTDGVAIINISDPTNPQEVDYIAGPNSLWRDLKTWEDRAYITNETSGGLMVIDLSSLPDSVSSHRWEPPMPDNAFNKITQAHNLYIDENGYIYVAGSNLNNGGVVILDANVNLDEPPIVGIGTSFYAHDAYVRGDTLYSSDVYDGKLRIVDVSDKANPQLIADQFTPFNFTHNAWLSNDGKVIYTTDEKRDAPVAAYDISDVTDIKLLDEFRPLETIGTGVIPHNVHVMGDDWLGISHYIDGGIIVDASRPDNLIEVANYDTYKGSQQNFYGAWGMYPFFKSGVIAISDMQTGLYLIEVDYKRACYLEGTVKDAETGQLLSGVSVDIQSQWPNESTSNQLGIFKTGQAETGSFEILFTKDGYDDKIVTVALENGVVTALEVEMESAKKSNISILVVDKETQQPLSNAKVMLTSTVQNNSFSTDSDGIANAEVPQRAYEMVAGAWGYQYAIENVSLTTENTSIVIELESGYQDDFVFDYGWEVSGNASAGIWELGEPKGTDYNGATANPEEDLPNDIGENCYVTGNAGDSAGVDDVDDGETILTSPVMDLSNYNNPIVQLHTWFYNGGGNGLPNDYFSIIIDNGTNKAQLERITASSSNWSSVKNFELKEYIEVTNTMTIQFITADQTQPNGHLVEAAVDGFLVIDGLSNNLEDITNANQFELYPNPVYETLTIDLQSLDSFKPILVSLYNSVGQQVQQQWIDAKNATINMAELSAGTYFVQLQQEGKLLGIKPIVRVK